MFNEKQITEIMDILIEYPDSKVYLGCDSVRFEKDGKRFAKYATVCIVHKDSSKGCRIFSHKSVEADYDLKKNQPKMRMLTEVRKVVELYQQIGPIIDGFDVEIHLDISADPKQGSHCAAQEATGYVLGMTQIEPKLKPDSFASSFGADAVVHSKA